MWVKFKKPALTFEQQADLLISRGLEGDRDLIINRLSMVSYYRLSGYWYTFRKEDPSNPGRRLDHFQDGTKFDSIWYRYVFDRHLRLLVMDAIERIEIAVRTSLAFQHAHAHGPFAYADDPNSLAKLDVEDRKKLKQSVKGEFKRSKESFVTHFKSKYGDSHNDLPVWMAVEIMTFGSMHTVYRGSSQTIRKNISRTFGVHENVFGTWMLTIQTVRNICAHHSRLWNREIGTKPVIPNKLPEWNTPVAIGNSRMFAVLTICKWSLDRIAPQSSWHQRFKALLDEYPDIPLISMGFPENWEECPIWAEQANR